MSAPCGASALGVSALGVSTPEGGVCSQGGVCSGGHLLWGVSTLEMVSGQGGLLLGGCLLLGGLLQGVSAPGGIPACTEADTPPLVNRMTDGCKNISLATTSLRLVKIGIAVR